MAKAKNFYTKIIEIWKTYIVNRYLVPSIDTDREQGEIDAIYYEEAHEHLKNILVTFEIEFGP